MYLHTTSALLGSKSQGARRTISFSRIHILLFIFPRILQSRVSPSVHLTRRWSPPDSFVTRPRNSPCSGRTSSFRSASFRTFLLPNLLVYLFSLIDAISYVVKFGSGQTLISLTIIVSSTGSRLVVSAPWLRITIFVPCPRVTISIGWSRSIGWSISIIPSWASRISIIRNRKGKPLILGSERLYVRMGKRTDSSEVRKFRMRD